MEGWEVTIAAFTEEESVQEKSSGLCQLEVALYRPDRSLEGIAVRITTGGEEVAELTDSGGVAIFNHIPVAQLTDVMVHIGL